MMWTKEEDAVLLELIGKHRYKNDAYIAASEAFCVRTVRACRDRWLLVLSKQPKIIDTKVENNDDEIQADGLLDGVSKLLKERNHYKEENEKLTNEVEQMELLIQKLSQDHEQYISEIEDSAKLYQTEHNHRISLENKVKEQAAIIINLNRVVSQIKKEKEEFEQEYLDIMNLFNKARRMYAGADQEESIRFNMDQNGNLERVR